AVCLLSNTQSKKKESYITLDVEMADYYRIKNKGKNSTTFQYQFREWRKYEKENYHGGAHRLFFGASWLPVCLE
ncbi:MAG: hypothetical protein J6N70_02540, partial [Oribacterium sp.]|nr:hypothetical protein [Oribacterium sp.]